MRARRLGADADVQDVLLSESWVDGLSADHQAARAKLAAGVLTYCPARMHELIQKPHAGSGYGVADSQRYCSDKKQVSVACI
jgi:hypothetical protein